MDMEQNDSLFFMLRAIRFYFIREFPDQQALIIRICRTMEILLGIQPPHGAGGVCMLHGWLKTIRESDREHTHF